MVHETPRPVGRRVPWASVFAHALIFATIGLLVWHAFYGVDFTDEAFYASIPWRFFLGDKPFIDETAIHQTFAFLTYGPLWLWFKFHGTTGVILYLRLLFVLFAAGVAHVAYYSLKNEYGPLRAAVGACAFLLVLATGVETLSYNTLGGGLITLAIFLSTPTSGKRDELKVAARGLFCGLAAVAYPPLVLLAPFVIFLPGRQRRSLIYLGILTFGLGILPMAVPMLSAGFHAVLNSYRETMSVAPKGGGAGKLFSICLHLLHNGVASLIPFLLALGISRIRKSWAAPVAGALFAAALAIRYGFGHVEDLSITSVLFLPFLGARSIWRREHPFYRVLTLSLLAGLVVAWSSSNGGVNFYVGSLAAFALVTAHADWVGAFLLPVLVVAFVRGVYRDRPISDLNSKIVSGPYAGLMTSPNRFNFIESLAMANKNLEPHIDRIVFMNDLPGGFLFSNLRPGICSTWVFTSSVPGPQNFRSLYLRCLQAHAKERVGVVLAKVDSRDPQLRPTNAPSDILDKAISACKDHVYFEDRTVSAFTLNMGCIDQIKIQNIY